eukprot:TCALIF_07403-PA protein Name:"Similar to LSM8 U6 snRNA-associated Sm-like protein LSm8 (Pongo abelii)" AED:0.32 eAED:0.32 QI:0/0.5/0.33/1/1/1/3/33/334
MILPMILALLHVLFDYCLFAHLKSKAVLKRLRRLFEDKKTLSYNELQWPKLPSHLALVSLEEDVSYLDMAHVLNWAIDIGIPCFSLFDTQGTIKANPREIYQALEGLLKDKGLKIKWHLNREGQRNGMNGLSQGADVQIALLDQTDGRTDIVRTAQMLAERCARGDLAVQDINEDLLDSSLQANHGLPDPDLMIRFGSLQSNMGFLPWQTRLTEMHSISSHHGIQQSELTHTRRESIKMGSALESFVNRMVSIITADGRNFIGTLKGFDQTINLILDDTHERIYSPAQGVERVVLGLHIVRGDNIALVGELDEDVDSRLDLQSMRADPIASMIH